MKTPRERHRSAGGIERADVSVDPIAAEVLAVDEALARLAARDPDQARVVEVRFFGGLSVEETAHVMDRSARTVKRDWRMAKAWLFRFRVGHRMCDPGKSKVKASTRLTERTPGATRRRRWRCCWAPT